MFNKGNTYQITYKIICEIKVDRSLWEINGNQSIKI